MLGDKSERFGFFKRKKRKGFYDFGFCFIVENYGVAGSVHYLDVGHSGDVLHVIFEKIRLPQRH